MTAPQSSASSWFSPTLTYSGAGRAVFRQPALTLAGNTTARFDEDGSARIAMIPQSLPEHAAIAFSGASAREGDTGTEWSISDVTGNPCERLEIVTAGGTFSSIGPVFYGYDLRGTPTVTFRCPRGVFRAAGARAARYWALPLQNFLTGFTGRYAPLDRHPLRLNPPSPDRAALEDDLVRRLAGTGIRPGSAHPLIAFLFRGAVAFLEPLPDYAERERQLKGGEARIRLTAVMVGETGGSGIEPAEWENWLPLDFLGLLGVACGTEVGAPWIEFRDERGHLVARFHRQLNRPCFADTRGAIDEGAHPNGIRRLLARALESADFGSDHLRVVTGLLLRGGWAAPSAEDRLLQLCRALETLCTAYGLTAQRGPDETLAALPDDDRRELADALADATRRITDLRQRARRAGFVAEDGLLEHMANQTRSADKTRPGFGRAVVRLLERFDLHDATAMADHERAIAITGDDRWLRKLIDYRNAPTHVGYFDFRDGAFDVLEVIQFTTHLHDLLTRLILRIVGYDGYYQPTVQSWTDAQLVGWVQPDTAPSRLGYR